MNETPKQQIEGEELEPRNTGNVQLDRLLNEAAIMPLAISSEEILHLIPKSGSSVSGRISNFKWIITGAVVLTGIVLYTLLSKRNSDLVKENTISNKTIVAEQTQPNDAIINSVEKTPSVVEATSTEVSTQKKLINTTSTSSNKHSIYLEGTKTVLLTHENKIVSIELNQSGVKRIVDDGNLVSTDNYAKYNEDIEQASIRTGIKIKLEEKKTLSKKEELAEAIIQGLYKEKLLLDGQSYDLTISLDEAILNGKELSSESRQKMLDIIAQTTGKTLPADGKIHIRH